MGRLAVVAAVLGALGGCGRFGFGDHGGGSDAADRDGPAGGDDGPGTPGDGPAGDASAACAAADICDGFESTTLDTSVWTAVGTVTRDTTEFHRGAASIKLHVDQRNAGQSGYATLSETRTFAVTPTSVWVRTWLRFASLPATSNGMELISALQTSGPDDGVYVFMRNTNIELYDQFNGNTIANSTPPPVGTWFCLVWQITVSTTTTGGMNMSSDIVPGIAMPNVPTNSSPPVTDLVIGAGFASGNVNVTQPAFDMWIDDVLVDTAALTCAD